MKVLFKNTTQYTKSVYEQYLQFHQKQYGFRYQIYTAIVVFAIILCLVFQVQAHYYTLAILFCFGLTGFFLWRFLHPIHQVQKELEGETLQKEKEFIFRFYETLFEIYDKKTFYSQTYRKLYRVFETNDYFYLYIDKTHAYILDKSRFSIGSVEVFTSFIKKKCFFKYKKKIWNS